MTLILAGRGPHLQKGDDEARLVFDAPYIVSERLSEKSLDVSLQLLPSLIRCLLIHVDFLLFLMMIDHLALAGLPAAMVSISDAVVRSKIV